MLTGTAGWECVILSASCNLKAHGVPRSLANDVEGNEEAWRTYYDLEEPELEPMPCGYDSFLSEFEKLCLLRCLRMDRVTVGITRFVIGAMGEKYVQPPVLEYRAIYKQSTETTPIVFVLSPGADPAFDVFKLGEEMGFRWAGLGTVTLLLLCARMGSGVQR